MARHPKLVALFAGVAFFVLPLISFAQLFPLVPVEELGLRLASGFRVTLYTAEKLGNDIFAMSEGERRTEHNPSNSRRERSRFLVTQVFSLSCHQ